MLFLNKLLPMFVLPLGWVFIFLLVALVRKKRWPVIVAMVALYVSSTGLAAGWLIRALESGYPPVSLDHVEKADAIVVLSGMFGPASPPGCQGCLPNLTDANERLEGGIQLWQRHKAALLVFTGGRIPWENQPEVEGVLAQRVAEARGVPGDQILITTEVGNTADESRAVATMMRQRGWGKIILVTSSGHMPRAARLFRKAGVDFMPFAVDHHADPYDHLTPIDFLPTAGSLRTTEQVLRELYGIGFYALFGR
jgi:uncharacterized SAM-binding protein YcdF (DUF218 family)